MINQPLVKQQTIWCILPAAGEGRRFNARLPKQYTTILGKPIITHTIERMLEIPTIEKVIVPIARKDTHWQNTSIAKHEKVITVMGGKERCYSVMHGLDYLKKQNIAPEDWVLVHDINRPCFTIDHVNLLLKTVCLSKRSNVYGGLLGIPIRDTVKRINAMQAVNETVDRADLWLAHTPQVFRFDILFEAMQRVLLENIVVTDEAMAVEQMGYYPLMVRDSEENIKITYPDDLKLAEEILKRQMS